MHFKYRDTKHLKGWKKIHQAHTSQKEAGMTILISIKVDFRAKTVTKEGYFIMIKVLG